ncbi:DNA repair endonuclease XPF [Gracilariopsis chorda]|uniref:DNA repair endonuclease XPF n=1 Tax=Gracilariopsis chorda TaxID=448386 RepID=A0A2V3IZJ4_9FLOR|nr:DNA repair endonuclease XPF [Gracilariopsis chorda]|eukprot:PXF47561.1 DNA repair endonuclease XPF [Gracilariopsis chorda]
MLRFHDTIGEHASKSDSLIVLGRGLGQHYGLLSLLQREIQSNELVIGMNITKAFVQTVITPALVSTGNPMLLPRHLTSDYSIRDRIAVYETKGFVTVTSNVLVHDLLHATLPTDNVTGLVIFDADRIREQSNEHFALTLFRTKNKTAFIKAFSENPTALTHGFHAVEKLMRLIYVSHLSLWPRFHHDVKSSMSSHTPDLIDLSVRISPKMSAILSSLRETVMSICEDLRDTTHALDMSELFKENERSSKALVHNFDDVIHRQLEGAEKRHTSRVRSLLSDLSTLRVLMKQLFELNSAQFYRSIVTIRATTTRGANWLVRKEAQSAVFLARTRVWRLKKPKIAAGPPMSDKKDEEEKEPFHIGTGVLTVPTLEAMPKWYALRAVLREIQTDVETAGAESDVARVIVFVREQRMVDELSSVLRNGNSRYVKEQFETNFPSVAARASEEGSLQLTITQFLKPNPERRSFRESSRSEKKRRVRQQVKTGRKWDADHAREELRQAFRQVHAIRSTKIELLIWSMEWVDIQGRGHRILNEYHPAVVILYNADISLIRQVEVYKAAHPGRPVRLYVLAYEDAVEEERFRHSSAREKAAFKTLIRERATMTILVNQEGREEEEFTQSVLAQTSALGKGSLRGLGADRDSRLTRNQTKPKAGSRVIVDLRELRSSLPMLLYKSCLQITPLTLEVGDFILSKNIGIERKSVPDLYGSFMSGRLFNQAEALCQHYKYPCLLIEMDSSKSLSLTATSGGVPAELVASSIVSKMVILLQQFPKLRLLWAQGPHDAAEMFAALKVNEDEPDEERAMSLGVDTVLTEEQTFNVGPKSLLRSLPGIDSVNINSVMKKVRNVATLATMSLQELTDVLGSAGKASKLFSFVNEKPEEALMAQ